MEDVIFQAAQETKAGIKQAKEQIDLWEKFK
jgi:hypothetical protein